MSSEARWLNMIEAEKNWLAVLFMTGSLRLWRGSDQRDRLGMLMLRDWLKHHRN